MLAAVHAVRLRQEAALGPHRSHHDGRRAVAEAGRVGALGIDDSPDRRGLDEQTAPVRAGPDQRRRQRELHLKGVAHRVHHHGEAVAPQAKLLVHDACAGHVQIVGAHGVDQQEVDLRRGDAGAGERLGSGPRLELRDHLPVAEHSALPRPLERIVSHLAHGLERQAHAFGQLELAIVLLKAPDLAVSPCGHHRLRPHVVGADRIGEGDADAVDTEVGRRGAHRLMNPASDRARAPRGGEMPGRHAHLDHRRHTATHRLLDPGTQLAGSFDLERGEPHRACDGRDRDGAPVADAVELAVVVGDLVARVTGHALHAVVLDDPHDRHVVLARGQEIHAIHCEAGVSHDRDDRPSRVRERSADRRDGTVAHRPEAEVEHEPLVLANTQVMHVEQHVPADVGEEHHVVGEAGLELDPPPLRRQGFALELRSSG